MYPNQNQYSIDYLNQIAPVQKKPGLSKRTIVSLIGAAVAVVLIAILVLFSQLAAGPTSDMKHLAARLTTLQTIATNAQLNIKSSQLRSTNSSLAILLTNANRDIVHPLANNNVSVSKIDKSITLSENGSALTGRLEDARLNAVYDGTYAREMSYQLATTIALMNKIYHHTSSSSLKSFLQTTDHNIEPIKQQFDTFNPTSS